LTTATPSKTKLLVLTLSGHLSRVGLDTELAPIAERLRVAQGREPLLVDCSTMTSYDQDARELFIDFNRKHARKLFRVAVVTEKQMWHLVVSVMALVAAQPIKAFSTRVDAEGWLTEPPKR
jgi:hypothetical protein